MDAHVVPGPSVVNVSPPVSLSPPVSPWPPVRKAWPDARTAERASMVLIVSGAAVLYGWDLDRQGWANAYYAAAAQAGAHSWKALLFGGLDAGGAMATDKPPLALWLMSGSVRIFGVNTWGIMLPQRAGSPGDDRAAPAHRAPVLRIRGRCDRGRGPGGDAGVRGAGPIRRP